MGTLKKALLILRNRPGQFPSMLRSYFLFARTRFLSRWFFQASSGVSLGRNARIQRLRVLSAERPDASVTVGEDCVIYENAQIQAYGKGRIEIGKGTILGDVRIYSRELIRIGERVISSWNVFIQDFDPHPVEPDLRRQQMEMMVESFRPAYRPSREVAKLDWSFPTTAVEIGNDVWLGANCTIMKGAKIGDGCIVAASAVVTAGQWPARSILAGVPAKVVKTL